MDRFHLEIITPYGILLSEKVEELVAPGALGEFGVLPGHVTMLTSLKNGELSYKLEGKTFYMVISGGYGEVGPERSIILTEEAERAEDIDIDAVLEEKRLIEERLKTLKEDEEGYKYAVQALEMTRLKEEVVRKRVPS